MVKFILVFFISFTIHAQSSKYLELDLEQCLQIALENNLQLKRSLINEQLQKVGYTQSLLQQAPTINLFSNYGNNFGRSIDPTTNTFISNNSSFSSRREWCYCALYIYYSHRYFSSFYFFFN